MNVTEEKPHDSICRWKPSKEIAQPNPKLFQEHQVTREGVIQGPWVIVCDVPNFPQYCYLSEVHTAGPVGDDWRIGKQFPVAHKKHLRPNPNPKTREEWPIHENALAAIAEVRAKIESGKFKVVGTRLVEA